MKGNFVFDDVSNKDEGLLEELRALHISVEVNTFEGGRFCQEEDIQYDVVGDGDLFEGMYGIMPRDNVHVSYIYEAERDSYKRVNSFTAMERGVLVETRDREYMLSYREI
jgi:hypothetical protein